MNSSYVVGIDVGGQTSKLGVVDARGTVLAQTVIRTDTYSEVEPYIAELAEAVKRGYAVATANFMPLFFTFIRYIIIGNVEKYKYKIKKFPNFIPKICTHY